MPITGKARIVARRSLSQSAYEALRTKILRGDLPLGTPLSRRKLAAELTMSMLPIGEALQRLEADGLIESRARVGTRVRIPTEEDVRGHYVIREALETMSARLFAERATAAERLEMMEFALGAVEFRVLGDEAINLLERLPAGTGRGELAIRPETKPARRCPFRAALAQFPDSWA